MPRFSTGARFLRAQRGPRPVRARLGAGRHRKGHPRPRQPHPCPALRPRPASRPVTEGTRRSALLPGRKPKSRAGAHSGANEAGPPTAVVADGLARTPSPTKAGSAARRLAPPSAARRLAPPSAARRLAPPRLLPGAGLPTSGRVHCFIQTGAGGEKAERTERHRGRWLPRRPPGRPASRLPARCFSCGKLAVWKHSA